MFKVIFEYMTGRHILGKNSNRIEKNPNKPKVSHVDEKCPWVSQKTTVYTRMNDQQILTMFFTYPDRFMDLKRYINRIDRAIEKLDILLEQNPDSNLLTRKKYLLRTGKEIFEEISKNFNAFKPDGQQEENKISLMDYGRDMVKKMMTTFADDRKKHAESISSDEASTPDSMDDKYEEAFEKVLKDYLNPDRKAGLQKRIEHFLNDPEDKSMEANCDAYRKLIDELKRVLSDFNANKIQMSKAKHLEYQARLIFCQIAVSTLRQASSSSCIERKFNCALRSVEGKRSKLSSEHIGNEVFLRSLKSEKESIKNLATLLRYNSKNFTRMMDSLNAMEEEEENYDVSIILNEKRNNI